ncbi:MAG: YggS family pyridoxal phosphate-dependent enzyme [Hyphomicrobiales bacterium]
MSAPFSRPYTVPLTISGGDQTLDTASISERLRGIRERIGSALERAGRPAGSVRLLAVTKGFPAETVRAAMSLGLEEFGENRVQEAEAKIPAVGPGPRWHLIGHLQTNKAKRAAALFAEIHSVDSERLAEALARHAREAGRDIPVWVEVNASGDASKYGASPDAVPALLERIRGLEGIRPIGLMTIGPVEGGADGARAAFRLTRTLRDRAVAAGTLPEGSGLSMGMTDDFEIAIEEGATVVRIGSALFGPRGADPAA